MSGDERTVYFNEGYLSGGGTGIDDSALIATSSTPRVGFYRLRLLNTDYIDIYTVYGFPPLTSVQETLRTLYISRVEPQFVIPPVLGLLRLVSDEILGCLRSMGWSVA